MTYSVEQHYKTTKNTDMQPGVYMLMGVNGVGKSTISERITASSESAVAIHASEELRRLFGGISRQELELLNPQEKLAKMVTHFTVLFDYHLNNNKTVLFDTHLLVPIRKDKNVFYENIWSDEYSQYISDAVMLGADPTIICKWRSTDQEATGRIRDISVDNVSRDQELNFEEFNNLIDKHAIPNKSSILWNKDGDLEQICNRAKEKFANI